MPEINGKQDPQIERIYDGYLERLIQGDRRYCQRVVEQLLDQSVSVRVIYEQLFRKSLYRIGELWERHELSVATEHLATAITEALMSVSYRVMFSRDPIQKTAIVACTANEHHQIGGKMVADLLEMHGWDAFFLGANTPLSDLLEMVELKQPDLVGLSVSVYFSMPGLLDAVHALRQEYSSLPILIGGQAFRWGGEDAFATDHLVHHVPSLVELERFIQDWDR